MLSYSSTQVVFTFGSGYASYPSVDPGDAFTVSVLGASFTGTVAYPQSVTIDSVIFTGTTAAPTVTVNGSGFGGSQSSLGIPQAPCGPVTTGFNYGASFYLSDATQNWTAGQFCDHIGLYITSYSSTQIVFNPGSAYPSYSSSAPGDAFTMSVLGASFTGTVAYPQSIASVKFTGTPAGPIVTVDGSGFGAEWNLGTPQAPCFTSSVTAGNDYNGNFYLTDTTQGWDAGRGMPGPDGCDEIGVNITSYSSAEVVFAFGSAYASFGGLNPGDAYTINVLGASFSGTVGYS